ncbi:MAG: ROK family protein [Chloroflexi bacterium]|nr:ROK family protein [Chloroflexota bacterium]
MSDIILAFDFGGTKLTAVSLTTDSLYANTPTWLAHKRIFSPPDGDAQFDISSMIALGEALSVNHTVVGIGVSFGGPVNYETGVVRLSHHVPGWEDTPLQTMLIDAFHVPVRVDNDANVAALGEWRFGAGQGANDLLYITVSTGVGGGWVLGGRPFRGHASMAGEIGHTAVDPNGPTCLCGKRGCVERLASGPYMAQDLAAKLNMPEDTITGKDVAKMARDGDGEAQQILMRGAWALGVGIGNAANLINPERIVLGGGITKSGDAWWKTIRQTANEISLPEVAFDIVQAQFADDAPLWGAVALIEDEIGRLGDQEIESPNFSIS